MKLIKNEKLENSIISLGVKITKEDFNKIYNENFTKRAKKIKIDGFNQGEATEEAIKKAYGTEIFFKEAVNIYYNSAVDFVKEETGINFTVQEKTKNFEMTETDYIYTFSAILYPKMTLKKYKDLEVKEVEPNKVTDDAIVEEIQKLVEKSIEVKLVEREACEDDIINFNFDGYIDGIPFEGGKADEIDIVIGQGQFIAGFEEQLIGVKANQNIDVIVTFPENYHEKELASKEAVFKCYINEVKEIIIPKIDDDFAKKVSEFNTLSELEEDVQLKLENYEKSLAHNKFEDLVIKELTLNLEGEIPKAMIERQIESLANELLRKVTAQGISVEEYLSSNNLDMKSLYEKYKPIAEHQVKSQLALKIVAEEEKLNITEEELDEEIKYLAKYYNMDTEQVERTVSRNTLKSDKLIVNAVEVVLSNVIKK